MFASWQALYETRAVGVYALLVLPALFLGVLAVRGVARHGGVELWAARFVRGWAIVFALTALFDPIATGILGWPLVPFVLLSVLTYGILLSEHDIYFYWKDRPPVFWLAAAIGGLLLLGALAFGAWLAVRWALALPIIVFEDKNCAHGNFYMSLEAVQLGRS